MLASLLLMSKENLIIKISTLKELKLKLKRKSLSSSIVILKLTKRTMNFWNRVASSERELSQIYFRVWTLFKDQCLKVMNKLLPLLWGLPARKKVLTPCLEPKSKLSLQVFSNGWGPWMILALSKFKDLWILSPTVTRSSRQEKQLELVVVSFSSVMIDVLSWKPCQKKNWICWGKSCPKSIPISNRTSPLSSLASMVSTQLKCKITKRCIWSWWVTLWGLTVKTISLESMILKGARSTDRSKIAPHTLRH